MSSISSPAAPSAWTYARQGTVDEPQLDARRHLVDDGVVAEVLGPMRQ